MTRSFYLWLLACACALCSACVSELGDTAILLTIDSDLSVPDELDRVTVEGAGFDTESAPSADLSVKPLPRSITLRHESGPYGPLEITVTGYRGEQLLVQRTLRTAFVPGYVTSVLVQLTRACANVMCGTGLTCEEGTCRGVAQVVMDAPKPDAATPTSMDAATPLDAGSVKADAAAADGATHRDTLSHGEVGAVADRLNVKREEVIEMEMRLSGGDVLLDPSPSDDGEQAYGPIAYLTDGSHEPTAMIESHQRDVLASDGIAAALEGLDDRSRRIVEERWLKVNDNGSGGMTLHELAAVYGVSAERIRQIEVAAMKKMRKTLAEFA